jgi:hypothetical protein
MNGLLGSIRLSVANLSDTSIELDLFEKLSRR